jgi:hypothetical protein
MPSLAGVPKMFGGSDGLTRFDGHGFMGFRVTLKPIRYAHPS